MGVPPAVCSNPGAERGSHPTAAGWNSHTEGSEVTLQQVELPTVPDFFSSTIFIVCPLFWGLSSVSRQVWKW